MKKMLNHLRPEMWTSKEVVIYKGPIPPNKIHLHRALQLIISPNTAIKINQGEKSPQASASIIIIPPFERHHISSTITPTLVLFYEPNVAILDKFKRSPVKFDNLLVNQPEKISKLIMDFPTNASEIVKFGNEILELNPSDLSRAICEDSRIEKILSRMENINEPFIRLQDIAGDLGLSESRLIHLFSEKIQMPFKSYYLWLKLRKALHFISAGHDLTYSAHEAGFTDSAHFSRSFSATFGFKPSYLKFINMFSA